MRMLAGFPVWWMFARAEVRGSPLPAATGMAVGLVGLGFVGTGLWARRDVRRALEQERIRSVGDGAGAVTGAAGARALATVIRRNTLAATGGRTYAEVDAYVGPEGEPTADEARAARDPLTGKPVENPEHELWVQSTTLQTALMQAYLAFRLSELTMAIGAGFAAAGLGLAAAGRLRAGR